MGYLYQPKYKADDGTVRESKIWWAQYYVNGRPIRESTGTRNKREAERFMKAREGRVAEGRPVRPRVDRITYQEIAADLRRHYETKDKRDGKEVEGRLRSLDAFFANYRAAAIDGTVFDEYVTWRREEKRREAEARRQRGRPHAKAALANGTINRELSILGTMLHLAHRNKKLAQVPAIERLKEAPPRAGFFERDRYEAVRRHLSPDRQVACDLGYTFGWRVRDEVLTLQRPQVDLKAGTIRLDPGSTKNDAGRVVYLTPTLTAALAAQLDRVRALERELGRIIPYVFPHLRGRLRGQRIRDFRKAWQTACRRAGAPGMLRHDFRRTAVRNLVNDGTPEKVAMMITGHKTRSVFDRYHIVAPEDLKAASARIAARDRQSVGQSGGVAAENLSRNP